MKNSHKYSESVTISFVDMYSKLKAKVIWPISEAQIIEMSSNIGQIAQSYGITAKACCEKIDLSAFGIEKARCIDETCH